MGIRGLLPTLEDNARPMHLSKYRDRRVAVHAFSWQQRACGGGARGQRPTKRHRQTDSRPDLMCNEQVRIYYPAIAKTFIDARKCVPLCADKRLGDV
jgi:XPG N-terminal domain